jgi:hypothetical protein
LTKENWRLFCAVDPDLEGEYEKGQNITQSSMIFTWFKFRLTESTKHILVATAILSNRVSVKSPLTPGDYNGFRQRWLCVLGCTG